ncbi:phage tail protein, partial [Escherichia coli]|nr:phage tail protein [Escherichia coli]
RTEQAMKRRNDLIARILARSENRELHDGERRALDSVRQDGEER